MLLLLRIEKIHQVFSRTFVIQPQLERLLSPVAPPTLALSFLRIANSFGVSVEIGNAWRQ